MSFTNDDAIDHTLRFVTFYISVLEILLLTYSLTYLLTYSDVISVSS